MSDTDSCDDFQSPRPGPSNVQRRQYLVTYSQADLSKFPTRERFGDALVSCFQSTGQVTVEYWACCKEEHSNDSGYHYHACFRLSGPKRWNPVKNALITKYGVVVNFVETDNYYSAYKYVCKTDNSVYKSLNHPDLDSTGSPKTKKCMTVYKTKCNKKRTQKSTEQNNKTRTTKKVRRLSNLEVSEFLVSNEIKTDTELFAKAFEQKEAGKKDLANFLMSRSPKSLQDLIVTTWKMQDAVAQVQRNKTARMEVIRENAGKECAAGCNGVWLECALEVLKNNGVHPIVFAVAMRELLTKGRGKFRNIMIVGPANCAKTFLLAPLQNIFRTFSNPANDKYAWLGAETAELIFLNDFRWSPEMIAWKELLLLLEGQTVHLPSPKNHYATDIEIDSDIPVVATGKAEITYVGKYNTTDITENEMMSVRWKVFKFHHQISEAEQKEISPCAKCFCNLTLMGEM